MYIYDKYNKIDVYMYNIKLSSQLFLAINQMPYITLMEKQTKDI